MQRSFSAIAIGLAVLGLFYSTATAAVPVLLQHQGRLLDASDAPLDGLFDITYAIFELPTGGAPLWTETHSSVAVTDGLFSATLGSIVTLTTDILAGSGGGGGGGSIAIERYLEVRVGADPPISPRLRLAAAPYAVASGRVDGDIVTKEGELKLKPNTLSTSDIVIVGDDDGDLFRIEAKPDSVKVKIRNHTGGGDPDFDLLRIVGGSGLGGGGVVKGGMIAITGDPDFDLLRMSATQDSAKIRISGQSSGDPDFDLLRISGGSGSGSQGAAITIGGDPDFDLLRIQGSSSSGPGGVTGASEISITGDPDFDLLRVSADKDSAKIRISGQSSGDPDFDLLRIVGGTGLDATGASVTITGDPDFDLLRLSADQDSARIRLGGKITGDPDFDLLRLAGGSGASHLSMHSEPSGGDARSHSLGAACDTSSAELTLESSTGLGGSTTATIRSQASPDSASMLIGLSDDAINMLFASLTRCDNGGVSSVLEADLDSDGVMENTCSSSSNSLSSSVSVSSRFGSGPRQTTSMDGSFSHAHLRCDSDSDDDGVEDNSVVCESSVSGAALRVISLNGLPPGEPVIDNIALTANDSSSTVALRKGVAQVGLGVVGAVGIPGASVLSSKCLSSSGLDSSSTEQSSDGTAASLRAINVRSTGSVLRAAATVSDSGTVGTDCDDDDDGHAEARGIMIVKGATGSGSARAASHLTCDSDDDGIADLSADVVVDEDSASFRLNGLPPGIPVIGTISMTASPSGVYMAVGQATCNGLVWANASDANTKENFQKVDGTELLEKLSDLEITRWNYKGDADAVHIGPTAQDFKETFGVGTDDRSISTIDPSGIALAAIKELYAQLKAKDKEMAELLAANVRQIEELRKEVAQLRAKKKSE